MANTLKIRQSAVAAKVPTTAQLQLGELALNTYDGRLFAKKNVSGTESIVEFISNSGTWGINITGSAATLTTARTINGTSFNGSANITTTNWGTARTLTIGNTGKSVDGSANASWSLAEMGALPLTGGTLTGDLYTSAASKKLGRFTVLQSGYLEYSPLNFRFDQDCLRYANRWGTATITAPAFSAGELDALFSQYASIVEIGAKASPCSIEITGIAKDSSANRSFYPYVLLHSGDQLGSIKMEVLKAGAPTVWEVAYDGAIPSAGYVVAEYVSGSGSLIGVRWTFYGYIAAPHYIRSIGCISRNGLGYAWSLMKGGDTCYGNLTIASGYALTAPRLIANIPQGVAPLTVTSSTVVTNLNADLLDGKHVGSSGNTIPLLDQDNTWSAKQTCSQGVVLGATSGYADYHVMVDIASAAGTWRRLATVASPSGNYATILFRVDVTDPQQNSGLPASVNTVQTETYYVACCRTESTVQDTPDACYVSGPSDLIQAVKTATGQYEIQLKNRSFYREYRVRLSVVTAAFSTHTVTYYAGDTAATGIAQYPATLSTTATDFFQNVSARQLRSTVATGVAPLTVTSSTVVTNLNADMVDGYHVGTSGSTIPRLDTANTWSALQTLSNGLSAYSNTDDYTQATVKFGRMEAAYLALHGGGQGNHLTHVVSDANPDPFQIDIKTETKSWRHQFAVSDGFLIPGQGIRWGTGVGLDMPTTTTRSVGTRVVLYPSLSDTAVDYALGMTGSTFWTSIPTMTSNRCFKQFAGTTPIAALHGDGTPFVYQAAPVTQDTAATLTAAQLRNGIVTSTPTAAITLTLPTGADTNDSLWDSNLAIDWTVINLATDGARTVTLASGSTHSINGNAVVAANTSARFRTMKTVYEQNGNPVFATYRIS